jgi:hypothetical protein
MVAIVATASISRSNGSAPAGLAADVVASARAHGPDVDHDHGSTSRSHRSADTDSNDCDPASSVTSMPRYSSRPCSMTLTADSTTSDAPGSRGEFRPCRASRSTSSRRNRRARPSPGSLLTNPRLTYA